MMKIHNGVIRNIVVLTEHGDRVWVMFEKCLKSFYVKVSRKQYGEARTKDRDVKRP